MTEPTTDSDRSGPDETPTYTLTVEEASALFASAGTPRSPRTIIRYCAKGHLSCIKADTQQNERYLISRESVDKRVEELRQLAVTRHDESRPDTSRRVSSDGDEPKSEGEDRAAPEVQQQMKQLEAEVRDLQITNRAKDYAIDQYKSERSWFLDQLSSKSHRIGELEVRLQLAAPEGDSPQPSSRPDVARPLDVPEVALRSNNSGNPEREQADAAATEEDPRGGI